ncbi:hypothetical protein ACFLTQ_02345 [Chloroflexota bacterium]
MPSTSESFIYLDIKQLAADEDYSEIYDNCNDIFKETLNKLGVGLEDVDAIAITDEAIVVSSCYNLEEVRGELEDMEFDNDTYSDEEVWQDSDRYIALMDNVIIIGSESNVKDCIKAKKDKIDSLRDSPHSNDVYNKLNAGMMMILGSDITLGPDKLIVDYYGFIIGGAIVEKASTNYLKTTAVLKFEDEVDAQAALPDVRAEIESDETLEHADVQQEGVYITAIAEVPVEFLAFNLSGAVEGGIMGNTYTSSDYNFSIDFPEGWQVVEGYLQTDVVFLGPHVEYGAYTVNINVMVQELPYVLTLDGYVTATIVQFERTYSSFEILEEGTTTINGEEAYVYVVQAYADQYDMTIQSKQMIIVKGATAFVVTYDATEGSYSDYLEYGNMAIQSFKLTNRGDDVTTYSV